MPKQNQVHDANNEHPYAVPISVSLMSKTTQKVDKKVESSPGDTNVENSIADMKVEKDIQLSISA